MSYTWKNAKYGILKLNYTCYYLRWYGLYKDERAIFCNLYRQILDALESVVDEPAPLARLGLNKAIYENMDAMDKIIANFKEANKHGKVQD